MHTKTYQIMQGACPVSMTRSSEHKTKCGNCRTESEEVFVLHGTILLGKRVVKVALQRCLSCTDFHGEFVYEARQDGKGKKPAR